MSDKREAREVYDPDDGLIELPDKQGSPTSGKPPTRGEDPPHKKRSLTERLADAARDRQREPPRD